MVWYSHLLKNFSTVCCDPHRQGFGIVSKAEVDVFLEVSCVFDDALYVGCWQLDLWFLCLFQLEHVEVHGSRTVEAWLGEF